MPTNIKYATISSGSTLSTAIDVANSDLFGLYIPIVNSCQLYLQGSFNTTSGNYARIFSSDGLADWSAFTAAGSRCLPIQGIGIPFASIKIETSVAQTDVRTFALVAKL